MSIDKVDVKLALVQKLESGIKKPATLATDVVNYFGAVNISVEEVTAVVAEMQHDNLIKPTGIGKSFLGLGESIDVVRQAISASVPNAVPVAQPIAQIPAPVARTSAVHTPPSMSVNDQAKAIVINTLRARSVGMRTLVNTLVMQFGVNVCSPDDAAKIISELFRERLIENAGGDHRQFIRLAEQAMPAPQIVTKQYREIPVKQPRKEPVARIPPRAATAARGRRPFSVERSEIEMLMTAILEERSVGRTTLINKVMTHFGAATLDVNRAEEILDALMRKGVIEQAGGEQRSLLALHQSKHASPIAEAVQKFVMKKGSVSLNNVRNFVARQLNETDGRRIQGTVAGSLRQLDPTTRKPLFVSDGNIVRFDPNHNKMNNDRH